MTQEIVKLDSPNAILEAHASGLISEEQGLVIFRRMVKEKFSDERIVKLVDELCTANDIKVDRNGNITEVPNWQARKDGLEKVLRIMQYMGETNKEFKIDHPTKVIFNVVNYEKDR